MDALRPGGEKPLPTLLTTVAVINILAGVVCCPLNGFSVASPMIFGVVQEMLEGVEDQQLQARQGQLDTLEEDIAAAETEDERLQLEKARQLALSQPPVLRVSKMYSMYTEPRTAAWFIADGVTGLLGNILLLISGIGLLKRRPWGRKLGLGVAAYKLLMGVGSSLWYGFVVMPSMFENMGSFAGGAPGIPPPNLGWSVYLIGAITSLLMFLYCAIYPVAVLVILNLESIRKVYTPQLPLGDFD